MKKYNFEKACKSYHEVMGNLHEVNLTADKVIERHHVIWSRCEHSYYDWLNERHEDEEEKNRKSIVKKIIGWDDKG